MTCCEPKQRILDAALELFAEKGFKATTIRDICKKAEVSLALVNYHFKNKQALYEEIVTGAVNSAFSDVQVYDFVKEGMTSEERLKGVIRLILHRLIGPKGFGNSPAKVKLIASEMTSPTDMMEKIFENNLSKMISLVGSIVKEFTGDIEHKQTIRFVSSIAGQCLHPLFARDILAKSGLIINSTEEDIETHAEHIYKFSLNGLRHYGETK